MAITGSVEKKKHVKLNSKTKARKASKKKNAKRGLGRCRVGERPRPAHQEKAHRTGLRKEHANTTERGQGKRLRLKACRKPRAKQQRVRWKKEEAEKGGGGQGKGIRRRGGGTNSGLGENYLIKKVRLQARTSESKKKTWKRGRTF